MANIEDVHRRLVELLRELIDLNTAIGVVGATEQKQDDQIVIMQDQLTELQSLLTESQAVLAELQAPTALSTQEKQDAIITELQNVGEAIGGTPTDVNTYAGKTQKQLLTEILIANQNQIRHNEIIIQLLKSIAE